MLPVIAGIGIGLSLIGTALGLAGQDEQSEAEEAAAKENARIAKMMAADAMNRGALDAGRVRMAATRMIGEQKAAYGASGIDAGSGSAVTLMANTRGLSELDVQMTMNNAAREAWGYRTQGKNYERQAMAIRDARPYQQVGAILGGLGQAASMTYSALK